jgi:glycosyltransferase involved in cell wall biosynthesis
MLRTELGLSRGAVVVVGAGRLSRRKGFDFLLDAFARAGVDGSELVLVGNGEEEAALRAQAAALGIDARARFAGERGDVPRVLGACDLFVLSSHNEGMANVMLEAMAAGLPVVAFDVSGVRDALGARDGRPAAGWIVPPADTDALAAAIGDALHHPDEAAARVAEASWRVRNWFSVERMVDEAEAILRGDGR